MKAIYGLLIGLGVMAIGTSPFTSLTDLWLGFSQLASGLAMVALGGIGFHMLKLVTFLQELAREERKQQRWKKYEDSIREKRESS